MMSTRIIFSDGSRKLANNLNDLRERWEMRRQQEVEYDPAFSLDIPTHPNIEELSIQDLVRWRLVLISKQKELEVLSSQHRKHKYTISRKVYERQDTTLKCGITYCNAGISYINQALFDNNSDRNGNPLQTIQSQSVKIHFLVALLRQHNIEIDWNQCDELILDTTPDTIYTKVVTKVKK